MRYVVLDTDVASRAIKGKLGDPLTARLTGMAWCVTFVTVGELWRSHGAGERAPVKNWTNGLAAWWSWTQMTQPRGHGQDLGGGQAAGASAASQR
jgi:predicted nucleic acid-binding protein